MPDATITSTASTFGTISGTFLADQSTITGTVAGVITGTLDGSVGVPGIGVPDGGTTGQVLKKASNTAYDTVWGTDLNAPAWGNITGTLSSQTDLNTALGLKLDSATAASTYYQLSNPSGFIGDAPSDGSQYARKDAAWEVVSTPPDFITSVSSPLWVASGNLSVDLSGYATETFVTTQGYLDTNGVAAMLAPYAELSSPTFSGVPAAPTAAVDTSTTQVASTAYVINQGYVKASDANATYAPKASPALTGTPTAPTASLGTNTTQIATTAFVLANAPSTSFATNAQVVTGTSTTTALYPAHAGFLKADPRLRSLAACNNSVVSGSGAVTANSGLNFSREMYLSSLAAGRAGYTYGIIGSQAGMLTSKQNKDRIDFSKKIWVSGSSCAGITSGANNYFGDANTICRISLGGYAIYTVGNMSQKGIGWKKVGGTTTNVTLTVHNGTTLTDVATSFAPAANEAFDWVIYSDGSGNVTLYINGSQAATTSAGPTGLGTATYNAYYEQVEAATTPGVRHALQSNSGSIYFAD